MSLHSDNYPYYEPTRLCPYSRKAANNTFTVFVLTRPGLTPRSTAVEMSAVPVTQHNDLCNFGL